ncbi:uncharacterized protein (TIGR02145 family) [Sediminitomix flava]|uniref:Uncharacterized protein (TIGR02145 family) n=2 Tax=Sediminitomix flava TaxID=379075 RepID=A0A315Z7P8_SEDFL|nr:uncharacterized protein (TIGR02145 family) [Sediminitomix flava]
MRYQKYVGILFAILGGLVYSCTEQEDAIPRIVVSIGDSQLDIENFGYQVELDASTPKEGQVGLWSTLRGANGIFEDVNDPNTMFKGEPGEIYTLQWTVSENGHSVSDVLDVSFKALDASLNVFFPDTVKTSFTLHLDANGTKYGGQGTWSYEGAEGATFEVLDSCVTKFIGLPNETYTINWDVTYGSQTVNTSFEVTFDSLRADAGEDQLYNIAYGEKLYGTLYPNHQEGATVKWTLLEGNGGIVHNPTLANSLFEGLENEVYKLRYEISHGGQTDADTLLYSFNRHSIWTDPEDNQEYKTVKINGLEWMAENYNRAIPGDNPDFPHSWYYGADKKANIHDGEAVDTPEERKHYGRLYTYIGAEAMAPEGWRLPTGEEVQALVDAYGGNNYAGTELKEGGRSGMEMRMSGAFVAYDHPNTGPAHSFGQGKSAYMWYQHSGEDPWNEYISMWVLLADNEGSYGNVITWAVGCGVRYVREVE